MIKTRFEQMHGVTFIAEMPAAVRVGEIVEIEETGRSWKIDSVAWVLTSTDAYLIARIKD